MAWVDPLVAVTLVDPSSHGPRSETAELHDATAFARRMATFEGVDETLAVGTDERIDLVASGNGADDALDRMASGHDAVRTDGREAIDRLADAARRDAAGLADAMRVARQDGRLDGPLDRAAFHVLRTVEDGFRRGRTTERIRNHCEAIRRRQLEEALDVLTDQGELTDAQRRTIRGLSAALSDSVVRSSAARDWGTEDRTAAVLGILGLTDREERIPEEP